MPFKLKKIKGGRFLVFEMIDGKPKIRANKDSRKAAEEFIKESE